MVLSVRLRELLLFVITLTGLEIFFFSDSLRPGWVLSAADWLLATESFREPGSPDYEPTNRLLTDIACQMEPWMQLAADEWHAGRVPQWNPFAGCGAPLLANAQSGVFFPINFIFFLTRSPYAWVAMAMVKLFVAGIGAFLLANETGLGRLGRWFAGLSFPFSGFVVVWLQYPMAGVAVFLPLVLWLVERLSLRPCPRRAGCLALVLTILLLGGHPETAAHILVLAGIYLLWRTSQERGRMKCLRNAAKDVSAGRFARMIGIARDLIADHAARYFAVACLVSFLAAAVQLVPLAEYLSRSQVWGERSAKQKGLPRIVKPDLMAMPALALPYVYGSHLRGHPHVDKIVGVDNFNEIAGGYTGLGTIALLVPLAFPARRRHRWIGFWCAVDAFAIAAVYRFPVIDQLLRLVPILNVMQNQRLLLVVSLAHCLLGGAGLETWRELAVPSHRRLRSLLIGFLMSGAALLVVAAVGIRVIEPSIQERALAHFERQAQIRGLPADALNSRALRMTAQAVRFFPTYYLGAGLYALALGGFAWLSTRSRVAAGQQLQTSPPASLRSSLESRIFKATPAVLLACTLIDLFLFGRGYNPAIRLAQYFPDCPITEFLRDGPAGKPSESTGPFPQPFRVLVMDEEFPPNVLGRYRIADIRNYDAIEVRDTLAFFSPLWAGQSGRLTSNSWTSWDRVLGELERLRLAHVRYLISTNTPPQELRGVSLVCQHGRVHVYELSGPRSPGFIPLHTEQEKREPSLPIVRDYRPGHIELDISAITSEGLIVVAETLMPGWKAHVDGEPCELSAFEDAFMGVRISSGHARVEFDYAPRSFAWGLGFSSCGAAGILGLLMLGVRSKTQIGVPTS